MYIHIVCLFTALPLKHSDVCYEIYLSVTYVQNVPSPALSHCWLCTADRCTYEYSNLCFM